MRRSTFAKVVLWGMAIVLVGGTEALCIALGYWWLPPLMFIAPAIGVIVITTLVEWSTEDDG